MSNISQVKTNNLEEQSQLLAAEHEEMSKALEQVHCVYLPYVTVCTIRTEL